MPTWAIIGCFVAFVILLNLTLWLCGAKGGPASDHYRAESQDGPTNFDSYQS